MTAALETFITICRAEYVDGLRLRISFTDGAERTVDFKPFLSKSRHPQIRRYLVKSKFQKFAVDRGHLHWNDFDLTFPIADLYQGTIT